MLALSSGVISDESDAPELKQSDSGENTNEQAPSVGSTLEDTQ